MKPTWLFAAAVLLTCGAALGAPERLASIYESPAAPTPAGQIDKLVFARLASLGIRPARCSDAVFVRRAYLDVIGTLPTEQEARDFLGDSGANKRRRLVNHLLEREEFADYWAMKWGDALRIKAEFPVNLWPNAAQAYHRWVRSSIAENKPYDKFVREMLTSSGSNFRVGPVNFYRAIQNRTPEGAAAAVALTFLGTRAEAWPKERLAGMAAFFAQVGYKPTREWKEEHVYWDALGASGGTAAPPPTAAIFPDGTKVRLPPNCDPREVFADWLIAPKNPWFARAAVNRVWAWLVGRGIVHEPDDFRADNPPSNPELLAYLESEFVASRYDLKRLYRLILNSETYQFSSLEPAADGTRRVPATMADGTRRIPAALLEASFARYPLRRLDAEVLIDAINKIAGTSDLYTSPIPEPFTYIPADKPAIAIADGSITSPFLTLFGRSARATGLDGERNNKPVPAQWLHMLNSSHIQRKLEQGPKLKAIFESGRKPQAIVDELYLTVLSRLPTPAEMDAAMEYGRAAAPARLASVKPPVNAKGGGKGSTSGKPNKSVAAAPPKVYPPKRRDDWIDIAWALINSPEFLYRH